MPVTLVPKESFQLTQKILNDNPVLVDKISAAAKIEAAEVPELLQEVVRFLYLIAQSEKRLTPSLPVDLGWHEFILCTRYYMDFCTEFFGRYIHHHPGGDEAENQQQYSLTLKLYAQEFGNPPQKYWDYISIDIEVSCGSCSAF